MAYTKAYEAEKAKYVDSLIFRVMELESRNEILREKMMNQSGGSQSTRVLAQNGNQEADRAKIREMQSQLNEANRKYRIATGNREADKTKIREMQSQLNEANRKYRIATGNQEADKEKLRKMQLELNEAYKKYRISSQQYAELKESCDAKANVTGLRKVARLYAELGFAGMFRQTFGKLKN